PDFARLMDEALPYVWHVLRRMGVPYRDREDLAQEVLFAVHRNLPKYDPARGHWKAWLHGFVVNVTLNYRTCAYRRREILMADDEATKRA
ncbi:hypothetical protein NL533_31605, partial [Klebsiella pneumoniae]|nr:hypothetical protein [Klebsiella pneumoniae]